jgi:hypothetical protein
MLFVRNVGFFTTFVPATYNAPVAQNLLALQSKKLIDVPNLSVASFDYNQFSGFSISFLATFNIL